MHKSQFNMRSEIVYLFAGWAKIPYIQLKRGFVYLPILLNYFQFPIMMNGAQK